MIWLDQVSMIWLDKEEKASAAALSLPSGHNPGATMLRYGANDPNRLEMACAFHNLVRECLVEDGLASYM